jgi:transcriptional regulator with XRE-family HTH domain
VHLGCPPIGGANSPGARVRACYVSKARVSTDDNRIERRFSLRARLFTCFYAGMPPRQKLTYFDDRGKVGRRVREARAAAGLSQRDLAFPGCTPAYISRIEKGDRVPSLQILREFANRLGVSESYLATGKETSIEISPLASVRAALRLGEVTEARELIDAALSRAATDQERAVASALYGEVALFESDAESAIDALERAFELDLELELRDPASADALGRAYARSNEYESAIGVFQRNFVRAREAEDLLNLIRFGALLANAYSDTGNFTRAEEILGNLISASSALRDPLSRARIYWAQSRMHALKREDAAAAKYAKRAIQVLEFSDQSYYAALAHQLLAHIEIERGNAERGAELLEQAAPLVQMSGRPFERASFELERARALMQLGREQEAASIAMGASRTLEHASPHDAGRGYGLVAKVFADLGDEDRAIELYELALERLEAIQTRYLVDTYAELAELFEKRGETNRALELFRKATHVERGRRRIPS